MGDNLFETSDEDKRHFAMLAGIVLVVLVIQLYFLRPKVNDFTEA